MRKEKAKKSRPWWGRGRESKTEEGIETKMSVNASADGPPGRLGGRGVSALTGAGTKVGAKTDESRE